MNFYSLASILVSVSFLSPPLTAEYVETIGSTKVTTQFVAPSKRFLATHPLSNIKPYFKTYGVTSEHVRVLKKAMNEENYGFFGYHGGKKEFRIYQDMIRFGVEEILGISIRPDFHFLRIPGDPELNISSATQFLKDRSYSINDDIPSVGKHILSMNMALYEHYWYNTQCSVYFFAKNGNWAQHNYEDQLVPFFNRLGVDPVHIHQAFEIAHSKLANSGVLFQFFDMADYKLVNKHSFIAQVRGEFLSNQPVSQYILDTGRSDFPQFRLLLNNQQTLNPSSSLVIKRYSLTTPQAEKEYEEAMRAYFQTLSVDVIKKEAYKAELLSLWKMATTSASSK